MAPVVARLVVWVAAAAGVAGAAHNIWPLPKSSTSGNDVRFVSPTGFSFRASKQARELGEAFERYEKLLFPHKVTADAAAAPSWVVDVAVEEVDAPLGLDTDESYTLNVTQDATTIAASTVWGALHGLETLSQLLSFDFYNETYYITDVPLTVQDAPRFKHRGILIDPGRHFESVPQVKAFVDSMVYAKLNVLHWHLTEDQSFPLASRAFPELPRHGAYSPLEQYSWGDAAEVIEYARMRGVRVIPEFDMPGHTSSWRNSHPELFAQGCLSQASRGAFDPALNQTFEFLEAVLSDWAEGLFVDGFMHLGSDEVPTDCWNNERDKLWMKDQGLADANAVFNYFLHRIHNIAKKLGKQVILWDEAFLSATPPKDVVIQNWHDPALFKKIVDSGYRGIYSSAGGYKHGWYLDALDANWQAMYQNDPMFNISDDKEDLVLGGEGCMWGETVDASDLEFTVWPRAAAIAERLWSPREATQDLGAAEPRLHAFRCLLLQRGVRAGFVGGSGRQAPPGPGSCAQGASSRLPARAPSPSTPALEAAFVV